MCQMSYRFWGKDRNEDEPELIIGYVIEGNGELA